MVGVVPTCSHPGRWFPDAKVCYGSFQIVIPYIAVFGRSLRVSGENGYMRDALFVLISISYGMVFLEGTRGLLCRSKSLSLPGYPCDLLNLLGALDSSQDYLYDLNIRRS